MADVSEVRGGVEWTRARWWAHLWLTAWSSETLAGYGLGVPDDVRTRLAALRRHRDEAARRWSRVVRTEMGL